jgi:hypothetical protein
MKINELEIYNLRGIKKLKLNFNSRVPHSSLWVSLI